MPEDYKNTFLFTKVLLRIVINPIEYHCNSTVITLPVALLSQKFNFSSYNSTKAHQLLCKGSNSMS